MFNENEYELTCDWHTHTIYSDGAGTIEDNVKEAVKKGLKSIAITEHGFNHFLNGVKRSKIAEMKTEIERLRKIYPIEILLGIEANLISYEGDIDLTQEECKLFDVINMGLHRAIICKHWYNGFNFWLRNYFWNTQRHSEKLTRSYILAMQKYPITTLVHLHDLKRVIVKPIAEEAVKRNVLIELNSKRIYFNQAEIDDMKAVGANYIINSDAHRPIRVGEYQIIKDFLQKYDFPIDKIVNLKKKNTK